MADHTSNALRAAARAMEEVVVPAVDPAHPLAREQAGLVLKYLRLFESRLAYMYDRSRFELCHYLELAEELRTGPLPDSPSISEALDPVVAHGRELKSQAGAGSGSPGGRAEARRRDLRPGKDRGEHGDTSGGRVKSLVLAKSKDLLDAQRAWFLPQGWEPDPQKVPR